MRRVDLSRKTEEIILTDVVDGKTMTLRFAEEDDFAAKIG